MTHTLEQIKRITGQELMEKSDTQAVLFSTAWCGECMIIESILGKIRDRFQWDISFFKVDTEKTPELKDFFGVYNLPTLVTIKNATIMDTLSGVNSRKIILNALLRISDNLTDATHERDFIHVQ